MMWKTIAWLGTTVEKVLPTLLYVREDWPLHSMSTCNGDDTDIFALTATMTLWLIIQDPESKDVLVIYGPHLLMALLCQIFMSTKQMPDESNGITPVSNCHEGLAAACHESGFQ
ncbi:maestro heat-like repeat-containing protein family member 1-like protein [Willisornis vidua]|uniref:Maestro heat-like repeat-containing protein family member 1-like protein n=1 Tax=Willisornis vidua TaxID=1566151 RepID=A0ABQ9D3P7_9PASS|nr:maestro heat-like repeat-containing protein family member 1-like protein [Willisornis vidua]